MFSRAVGKQYWIPHLYNVQCIGRKEITGFGNLEVTGRLAWIDFCGWKIKDLVSSDFSFLSHVEASSSAEMTEGVAIISIWEKKKIQFYQKWESEYITGIVEWSHSIASFWILRCWMLWRTSMFAWMCDSGAWSQGKERHALKFVGEEKILLYHLRVSSWT